MTDEQVEPAEHAAEGAVEDLRIAAFWQAARGHVGMGKMDQVLGGTADDVVPPPSWSYGDDAEADELLARASTVHDADAGPVPADGAAKELYLAENARLGSEGLRVLATARKDFDATSFDATVRPSDSSTAS